MANQTKFILRSATMLIVFTLHVAAFDTFIQSAYKQDYELTQLKKQYKSLEKQKTKLGNTITNGHNQKIDLHVSILEKQKTIALNVIMKYFIVLANKEISLLYNEDNQIQNKNYNQALNNFKDYTGLDFKKDAIEKVIDSVNIPKNYNDAYQIFTQQDMDEKLSISKILKINDSQKAFISLRSYYNQYINMINNLKTKIDKINNTKQKLDKEKLTLEKIEYIKEHYKILFQKCKILFVIGTLQTKLSTPIAIKKTIKKQAKIKDIKLRRIHFMGNSSEITSYSINIVKQNAKKLLKLKNFILELHGYSDNFGDKKDNYRLSKERVEKTKRALVKFGLKAKNIKIFYYGDEKPIKTNKTEHGRLLNRRVEFKIFKDKK